MAQWSLITRSDDLGSSHSANLAIARVADAGVTRNVSIMACGPYIEEASQLLAHRKDICFGMHVCINAEWDRIKWGPVSVLPADCGLLDENGYFQADPMGYWQSKPPVEVVMKEVSAQLDKLTKLGFPIRYVDTHMFSEIFIEGLDEALPEFIRSKGLLDHMCYYNFFPADPMLPASVPELEAKFRQIPKNQYFFITHPSLDTEEMWLTGNATTPTETVVRQRAAETAMLTAPGLREMLEQVGVRCLRYDEAIPGPRLTAQELAKGMFNQ